MVTVIILVLISFSLIALFKIKQNSDAAFALLAFRSDSLAIYSAAEDVCALGNGNSRLISIKNNISVSADSGLILFEYENNRIVKKFTCDLLNEFNELSADTVTVVNNNGEIEFSNA